MRFLCGYCKHDSTRPPRQFVSWEDLIDHLISKHGCQVLDGKLVKRRGAVKQALENIPVHAPGTAPVHSAQVQVHLQSSLGKNRTYPLTRG